MRLSCVLFATTALACWTKTVEADDDTEWHKYGCDDPDPAKDPMSGCFCGFLRDRIKDPWSVLTSSELTAQSAMACTDGMAGEFPCQNVDLQSHLPLSDFASFEANDIWGWTDESSGREFAIMGVMDGTVFVEISDPANPFYLGKLPTHTDPSVWRDIKTYANHAFIVSEADFHGMQIFDLTQLLTVAGAPVTFSNTAHYGNVGKAHNIFVNEETGVAYIVGEPRRDSCRGGLHMVDVSTPASPKYLGCFSEDGYVHDTQCVIYNGPATTYKGREICFCSNEDTVTIVDVTDKTSPTLLSKASYSQFSYTHQGWLSPDHRYFIFGDETDETDFGLNTRTFFMDVQDLDDITFVGSYRHDNQAIDHNLYTVGDTVYAANYRSGLRILRVTDYTSASMEEIGFFDIFPTSDSNDFNGAWSVYPYFPSGNVIISGIEQGLFVVKLNLNDSPTPRPSPSPTPRPSLSPTPEPTPCPAPEPTPCPTPRPTPSAPRPTPSTTEPTPTIITTVTLTYRVSATTVPSAAELAALEQVTTEFFAQTMAAGFPGPPITPETFVRQDPSDFADQQAPQGWTTIFLAEQVFDILPTTDEAVNVIEDANYESFIFNDVLGVGPYFALTQGLDLVAAAVVKESTPEPTPSTPRPTPTTPKPTPSTPRPTPTTTKPAPFTPRPTPRNTDFADCKPCDKGACTSPVRCLFRGCTRAPGETMWSCHERNEESASGDACTLNTLWTWKCASCNWKGNGEQCCLSCYREEARSDCPACDDEVCAGFGKYGACLYMGCEIADDGFFYCDGHRAVEDGPTCGWNVGTWRCDVCWGKGNDLSCCKGCTAVRGLQ